MLKDKQIEKKWRETRRERGLSWRHAVKNIMQCVILNVKNICKGSGVCIFFFFNFVCIMKSWLQVNRNIRGNIIERNID